MKVSSRIRPRLQDLGLVPKFYVQSVHSTAPHWPATGKQGFLVPPGTLAISEGPLFGDSQSWIIIVLTCQTAPASWTSACIYLEGKELSEIIATSSWRSTSCVICWGVWLHPNFWQSSSCEPGWSRSRNDPLQLSCSSAERCHHPAAEQIFRNLNQMKALLGKS